MYEIVIGELSEDKRKQWDSSDSDVSEILDRSLFKADCSIGTLPIAAKSFHDELQIDWGSFAWKAFRSEIGRFFRRKGIPEQELKKFDPYKEYGVVYIDK